MNTPSAETWLRSLQMEVPFWDREISAREALESGVEGLELSNQELLVVID